MNQRALLARALGVELPEMRVARFERVHQKRTKARRRKAAKAAAQSRARNR